MDRNEMWARMAELDAKDELTEEEQQEYYQLWSQDWEYEQQDTMYCMYGFY